MFIRPLPVTIAVVLLTILSLANLLSPVMPSEGVPTFVGFREPLSSWQLDK